MNGARQFHLTLNVEKAFFTGIGAGRHAHRKAKAVVPQIHHGEPIDLSNLLARHDQQTFAIHNGLLQSLLRVVVSVNSRLSGLFHIDGIHGGVAALFGQRGTFNHQGLSQSKDRALSILVICRAMGLFDQGRHGGGRKMRQIHFSAGMAYKNSRGMSRLGGGRKALGKIDLATKAPGKLRVGFLHCVVLVGRSYQNNLHIDIQRFGLQ